MKNKTNSIQWESLEHAYGPATDIPELLEKIEANDAKSVTKLANCIAHQGWATPPISLAVIPFLFELVTTTSNATKAKLIALLSDLACAGSHEHFMGQRMQGNIFQELIATNKDLAAMRDTISSNGQIVVEHLKDTNAGVRSAVAQFMAVTSQTKSPLVLQISKEKNKTVKGDMLIALGWTTQVSDIEEQKILESFLMDSDDITRFGATLGLAYSAPITNTILENIYQIFKSTPVKQSIWCSGHFYEIATTVLIERSKESKDASLLINAFEHVPEPYQSDLIVNIIRDNFKREMKSMVKPPKLERLTDLQKSILKLIVDYQIGVRILEALGLPDTPPGISLYLGIPLPVEIIDTQSISFDGMTGTLREIINHHCNATTPKSVDEEKVRLLAETIAANTEIHQFMDVAYSISKISKTEKHLLILYFLLTGRNAGEPLLSKKIDELLERGGTQFYYYANPNRKGQFFCGGDQFLLILYWTALYHLNPNHPIPTKVEKWPRQSEPRSLYYAYRFFGLRIYAGYKASAWFRDAYIACKSVWPDMAISTHDLKEYGWDESQF